MSTPHKTWTQVETRVKQRVASRKLRHARFWKLQGVESKKAVLQGTVARLMAPDAVFPYALRKRIAPRPLVAKGAPSGWVAWRPVYGLTWAAWRVVHRSYIECGSFWFEKNAATDNLIDLAVDAERHAWCASTSDSGGPNDGKSDPEALENLSRHTEAGQAFALEPSREFEQQKQIEAEAAALVARESIEAEELVKFREAVNSYARKLPQKQRRAVALVVFEPSLKGFEIAAKCRVSESTVSKLRTNIEELADKTLTIPDEEGAPADVPTAAEVPHDELLSQAADAGEVEGAEIDATADLGRATLHSDLLDLAATLQAPDVDADVSEATLRNYARRGSGGGGKRRFSDSALITGNERYGGKYANPAEIALRAERERMKNYSESEMKAMQETAVKFGVDLQGLLKSTAVHLANRLHEAEQAKEAAEAARRAARRLRGAAFLLDKSADEVADLRAFATWFCPTFGSSVDDLLGACIVPKTKQRRMNDE